MSIGLYPIFYTYLWCNYFGCSGFRYLYTAKIDNYLLICNTLVDISLNKFKDMAISAINQRLTEFINTVGTTKKEFERNANLSNGFVDKAGNSIRKDKVDKILFAYPDLNRDWLVYGEGEMLKSESAAHRVENNVRPILVGEKEWADVPLVPFSARAGALSGFGDPQWLEDKQTMQVLVDSRLKGDYVLFEVEGDSMDDGSRDSFLDGDVLLCRVVPQSDWQYSIKKRRATFCVLATKQDGIALKQITKHDRIKQVITCHSLNPAYDDYEVALSDVQAIFYVEELNKRVY